MNKPAQKRLFGGHTNPSRCKGTTHLGRFQNMTLSNPPHRPTVIDVRLQRSDITKQPTILRPRPLREFGLVHTRDTNETPMSAIPTDPSTDQPGYCFRLIEGVANGQSVRHLLRRPENLTRWITPRVVRQLAFGGNNQVHVQHVRQTDYVEQNVCEFVPEANPLVSGNFCNLLFGLPLKFARQLTHLAHQREHQVLRCVKARPVALIGETREGDSEVRKIRRSHGTHYGSP